MSFPMTATGRVAASALPVYESDRDREFGGWSEMTFLGAGRPCLLQRGVHYRRARRLRSGLPSRA